MNTETIRKLLTELDSEKKLLNELELNLTKLQISGQESAYVKINGVHFDLTTLSRDTGYMSYPIESLNEIRFAAIKVIESQIVRQKLLIEVCKKKVQESVEKDLPEA